MSSRDRRAMIVGVMILVALVAIAKGIPAIRRWESLRIAHAQATVRRLRELERGARERNALVGALTQWRVRGRANDSLVFAAMDAGAAGAKLVGAIRSIALDNEILLHGVQPRTDSTRAGSFIHASASVSATADVEALMKFLVNIETARPMLRIAELSVVQAEPNPTDDRADNLKVEMTVQGLARVAPRTARVGAR